MVEGERTDGSRCVGPDAGQGAPAGLILRNSVLGELAGRLVERDRATVVAEALPGADYVCP